MINDDADDRANAALAELDTYLSSARVLALVDDVQAASDTLAGENGIRDRLLALHAEVSALLSGSAQATADAFADLLERTSELEQDLTEAGDICFSIARLMSDFAESPGIKSLDDDDVSRIGGGSTCRAVELLA